VGDDAKFQMEFEARGAWWETDELDGNVEEPDVVEYADADSYYGGLPVIFISGDAREAIWGWNEPTPLPLTLSDLHSRWGLGSRVSVTLGLPYLAGADDHAREPATTDDAVEFETIALSHDDEIVLESASAELSATNRPLRERVIGELLEIVLARVQGSSQTEFMLARPLSWDD